MRVRVKGTSDLVILVSAGSGDPGMPSTKCPLGCVIHVSAGRDPSHQRELAIGAILTHDGRHLIRKHARQRWQIAREIPRDREELADRVLPAGDAVEIAHILIPVRSQDNISLGCGNRFLNL